MDVTWSRSFAPEGEAQGQCQRPGQRKSTCSGHMVSAVTSGRRWSRSRQPEASPQEPRSDFALSHFCHGQPWMDSSGTSKNRGWKRALEAVVFHRREL